MAYVPGFRYDIFISYASEDNADGWVEKFETALTAELTRLLGRPFSAQTVYLDKRGLTAGKNYPTELEMAARSRALLIPLLSPSYLNSDWCSAERSVFQERLPQGDECIAAVRVRPVAALPRLLRETQRIDFVIEGFQEPWPAGSGKWIELVHKLAAQTKPLLEQLRKKAGAVFVGVPLRQHMELRTNLASDLSALHFRATPDAVALLDDPEQRQQALAEAACAVHFIGGATDDALQAIEESVFVCPGKTVLFTPFGAQLSAQEEEFLAGLDPYPHRTGPNVVELQKFLEDLLTTVRQAAQPAKPPSLAVVCEPADFGWAAAFTASGLTVDHPRFLHENLNNMDRIKRWKQFVCESHGLLFYQGQSDGERLERIGRMADDQKVDAPRRWYLDEPNLEAKRKHRPDHPAWAEGLDAFLDEVRRRAQGGGGK